MAKVYFILCMIISSVLAIPFSAKIAGCIDVNQDFNFLGHPEFQATWGALLIVIGVGGLLTLDELYKTSIALAVLGVLFILVMF